MSRIYLDYGATTPVDPHVLDAMLPYFSERFGNAASTDHAFGSEALSAVETARGQVAALVGVDAPEIIFTSGATESNNLAILGAALHPARTGRHILTSAIEHPSVLDACAHLEQLGFSVTYLPVGEDGLHTAEQIEAALQPDTTLVTIMAANNEIGVIQPVEEIAQVTSRRGVLFHTDATQAVTYEVVRASKWGIDLLSVSAHKMYGPKGVGALYVRRRSPRVRLVPRVHGGGHERGLRSGTLNTPGVVGMGAAAALVASTRADERKRVAFLRDQFWREAQQQISGVQLNGDSTSRLPNNINMEIPGIEARSLVAQIGERIAISTGSACATAQVEPSHVILALGHDAQRAHASVRLSFGRYTTAEDAREALEAVAAAVHRSRELSGS